MLDNLRASIKDRNKVVKYITILAIGFVLLLIFSLTIWPRSEYSRKLWFRTSVELDDDDFDYLLDDDTLILFNDSTKIEVDYFSYGLNSSHLNRIDSSGFDDYIYGPFHVGTNFTAHNQSFKTFNIFVDGYVTFTNIHGYISLCPFYSDIDMSRKGDIYHGEMQDARMVESIGADIRRLCKYEKFSPKWVYMITWFACRPSYIKGHDVDFGANSNYSNTFQLLMISNGVESFALFNFVHMEWPNSMIENAFTSSYYYSYYDSYSYSNGQRIFEDSLVSNLTDNSNMDRPGRWFITFNNTNCRFGSN